MENNIKKDILDYVKDHTVHCNFVDCKDLCAASIADTMNASRTVVSQYLNEFHSYKTLVKVNTRPVLFFDRISLSKQPSYLQDVYNSLEELKKDIAKANSKSISFTSLIGHQGSLNSIIQNCKSAITYPNNGLPILLLGPTGAGKSLIAQTMFRYGQEKGIFKENARFITVNCSEYSNNPEFFLTNLFGFKKGAYTGADKDREGLIALADGGMIFLDEVHSLSKECQEKLFLFMDKGIYHMVGDNDKWYEASEHIVFATTEDPRTSLLKTLYRRIPIVTHVPSLAERPKQEKMELLIHFLEKEVNKIQLDIGLSRRLYETLVEFTFQENVGQVENCIKVCVGNAYVEKKDEKALHLDIRHLPDYMIEELSREGSLNLHTDSTVIDLFDLKNELVKEQKLYSFNEDLLMFDDTKNNQYETFMNYARKRFRLYLDSVTFDSNQNNSKRNLLYHNVIETICEKLSKKYNVEYQNNEILNLARILNDYVVNSSLCEALQSKHYQRVSQLITLIRNYDYQLNNMCQDFCVNIKNMLNIEMDELAQLDAMIYLKELSKKIEQRETRCMILSHGYSTASSMAAVVNHMIGDNIFDSIDMPMDVNVITIAKKLSEYVNSQKGLKDLVILVDMGALEDIHKRIVVEENVNIVIFNNVTIKLALDVGLMVNQKMSLYKIRDKIDFRDYLHKSIMIENRKKQKAIVTVCSTGIATAERISSLIETSLPPNCDIAIVAESYQIILQKKINADIFEKYDVLFIVGTINPQIENIMYISIEDMIEKQNIEKIKEIMAPTFNDEQISMFSQNIIKNFSLQNLLNFLTILNPEKIVNYVEDIIESIQSHLRVELAGNAVVGLYLHISCLIERLITDKYITNYDNLDTFIRENEHFIKVVKEAFKKLEKSYCVEIPVSEIAYIYDYIYNYPSVEKTVDSDDGDLFS